MKWRSHPRCFSLLSYGVFFRDPSGPARNGDAGRGDLEYILQSAHPHDPLGHPPVAADEHNSARAPLLRCEWRPARSRLLGGGVGGGRAQRPNKCQLMARAIDRDNEPASHPAQAQADAARLGFPCLTAKRIPNRCRPVVGESPECPAAPGGAARRPSARAAAGAGAVPRRGRRRRRGAAAAVRGGGSGAGCGGGGRFFAAAVGGGAPGEAAAGPRGAAGGSVRVHGRGDRRLRRRCSSSSSSARPRPPREGDGAGGGGAGESRGEGEEGRR